MFDENGRPTFTEKPVLEMLAFYKELNDCCLPPGWLGHGYRDNFVALATGKVASILGWGRGAYTFEKLAPDLVKSGAFGVMPGKPVGPSGTSFLTQLDCEPWMVFKDAKYPEIAADFLKFFYQMDNYRKYIQTVPVHFFPITKSLRADAAYKATPDFKTWVNRGCQFGCSPHPRSQARGKDPPHRDSAGPGQDRSARSAECRHRSGPRIASELGALARRFSP